MDQKTFEIQAKLTGYAYETEPNVPILAGQTSGDLIEPRFDGNSGRSDETPGARDESQPISQKFVPSLGLLALGAPGLDIWRRRDVS